MNNLIVKIENHNWGEMGPGDWELTEWNIYEDLTVIVVKKYRPTVLAIRENLDNAKEKIIEEKCKISKEDLAIIISKINEAKSYTEEIKACDGVSWKYILYENGEETYNRPLGYIYGIKPLEEISPILRNIK